MTDSNLLESYNPLYDVHLRQYFALPHMQKHLRSLGLLDSNGVPVAQNSTTNNVESQLYQRHQVMMDMMLRNRERVLMQLADLQKKLDAAEKVEIYRRIRQGITNPEEFRRQHITTRSFSRPARGRQRSSDKSDRQRRHSNSYDESELMKRIESENESAQNEYAQQHKSLYSRLAANAYKYQYLHKLDDRTLLNYKETLRKQLQKLERFREAAFGPHSVAKHQPNPQNSWFFRRRPSKSSQRARAGKSMSPPRNRLPTTVHSPQSQPSARTSAQPKPKKAAVRKLPPIQKDKSKKSKTTSSSENSENQQKLPPTAVIRPSKKTEELKENGETENRPSSNSSVAKLPILGAVAAAVGGVAAGLGLTTRDPEPHPEVSDTDYSRPETEASGALPTSDADLTDATSPQPQSDVEPEEHEVDNQTPPYEQDETPKEENAPVQPFAEASSPTVEEVHVEEKTETGHVPAEVHESPIDQQEEEIHARHTREVHAEPPSTADVDQLDDGETLRSDVEMHSPEQPVSPPHEKQEEAVYDAQHDVVVHRESDNEDAQSDKTHDAVPETHSIDDFEKIQTTESVEVPADEHEEAHESHSTPNQLIDEYGRGRSSAMSKDSIEALSHTQAKESDVEQESLHPETYEPMNVEPEHEEEEFAVATNEAVNQLEHHDQEINTGNYEYENSMVDAVHEYDDSLAQQNEEHPEVQATPDHLESDRQVEIEHEEPQTEERKVISQQSHKLEDSHEDETDENELNENAQMMESIYQQQHEEHPESHENEELIEKEDAHQNYSEDPEHRSVSANQENSQVDHQEGGYESESEDVNQQSEHQFVSRDSPVDQNNEMHQSTYQHDDRSMEHQDTEHENAVEDAHSEHQDYPTDHSIDQTHENENVEEHQSTYDERPHSPEYERYDKHRDSFGEQSESEPNLHYSEPLQPLTTDAMQEYANQYQDEYDNMQVIEGESLRETSDEDTLGRSAQSDQFAEQRQDADNVTAAEPATFESMVVHHDEQNEDVGSISHKSYQHDEDEEHELIKRSAEPETHSPPPSSHQSLLVPQPSIEVTPASDYGSTDRLDQIDTANASSTDNRQEAPESQSSQQSSPRTETHEDEQIETIPPPVSHSPLTADEEPHHLPESPEPHPQSTLIPEQNDENGEALTIPEDDQVVPRDSITDEYVTDSLGLTDGEEPDEHHDYEPMEHDQSDSHYDGNSQDEHTDHRTEETSHSEHAPSTARTENSEEAQRHELMSQGYEDEEQTTDLDSYIQQHAHELEAHSANLHDPEHNVVEDQLNANINVAAPLHSTIDPSDGNENGVHSNASVEEYVQSNGVNGNGDFHSNGYNHDEHNGTQTYDSRNETPLTRKSVDQEDEEKSEEGSETGSVIIHGDETVDAAGHVHVAPTQQMDGIEKLTSSGLPG
ncbi:hypothetical protein M3Y95_00899600 [Aphelenchoides besseyi]|nr:hypothetical protein M3Y95_00899600 [Aphelenchoides besseyi]